MAKTPVSLSFSDNSYKTREVQMVKYEFDQAIDVEGQMSGIPRGGKLVVRVKALNDGSPDLLAWMVARNLAKDGTIEFLDTKNNKSMKKIEFQTGYCVEFQEHWEEGHGHFEQITITCKNITFGDVKFENAWE